jgi:NAD(P)H-nitrite reductase large subunit
MNRTVREIKPKQKTVVLDDGAEIPYDKLLVATGSSPFVPPAEGIETVTNSFTFLSLEDAKKLQQALTPDSRVLIVGAGLIGLKCAEGIHKKVGSITVLDLAPRILSSILDEEGAQMVQQHIEKFGVQFLLSCSVKKFDGNRAHLSNGQIVDFDVLVMAVGVRPNVDLVKNIGGKVNRGIITDEFMETSIPDIYAAGDCTESMDISADTNRVLALLPNASMQGECAGINMAGGTKTFCKAIPMNAIGFMGLHMITAGSYIGETYTEMEAGNYKKLFVKDGLLKGYIMIGNVDKAGIYTSLIRDKVPLDTVDFELIRKKPSLMAFSMEHRRVKLGGVAR